MACLGKLAGYHTTVLTRKPEKWSATLGFKNEDSGYLPQEEYTATVDSITSDPATCIPEADVIFIAGLPIHLNPVVLQNIRPHINREKEFLIGTICAYGGFNWVCAKELGPGKYHIYSVPRRFHGMREPSSMGKKALCLARSVLSEFATENGKDGVGAADAMQKILQLKDVRDTDFLACTLWPNNPWIHPPILYGVFKDWDGKSPYAGKEWERQCQISSTKTCAQGPLSA